MGRVQQALQSYLIKQDIMWIVGSIALFFLLVVYLYYSQFLKPKRLYDYYLRLLRSKGYKVYAVPFKPMGVPVMETMKADIDNHKDFIHISRHDLVGYDVILTNFLSSVQLSFIRPDLGMKVIDANAVMLAPKSTSSYHLLYRWVPDSILFLEGQPWKHRRKLVSSIFHYNYLMSQVPTISLICDKVIAENEQKAVDSNGGIELDLFKIMSGIFGKVIITLFVGMEGGEELVDGQPINQAVHELHSLTLKMCLHPLVFLLGNKAAALNFNDQCRRLNQLRAGTKQVLMKSIRKYIDIYRSKKSKSEAYQPQNIIEFMIKDLDGTPNMEEVLFQEVYIFFAAGQDTSASLIIATIYHLYQNPSILQEVRDEIEKHIGAGNEPTAATIKELKFMERVLKEANRLNGPSPGFLFDRIASQDWQIADIPIKRGVMLNYMYKPNMFNPENFDSPSEFRPHRYEDPRFKDADLMMVSDMDFSGGPRTCIGKYLAYLEMKIALVKFLRRYKTLEELKPRVFDWAVGTRFRDTEVRVTLAK